MSKIWDCLINSNEKILSILNSRATLDKTAITPIWISETWTTHFFRKATVTTVDARESHGIWMSHFCVYPNFSSDAPICCYDVIAGKDKVTGLFHDHAPLLTADHPMNHKFIKLKETRNLPIVKERSLPEWAKQIFSEDIIAVGNIRNPDELKNYTDLVEDSLDMSLEFLETQWCFSDGGADEEMSRKAQERYRYNQKLNPHTPKVMKSLGLSDKEVEEFINTSLFGG